MEKIFGCHDTTAVLLSPTKFNQLLQTHSNLMVHLTVSLDKVCKIIHFINIIDFSLPHLLPIPLSILTQVYFPLKYSILNLPPTHLD